MIPLLKNMKKDPRRFAMTVGGVFIAVAFIYIIFILKPQAVSVIKTIVKNSRVRSEIRTIGRDMKTSGSLKADIELYRKKVDVYEKRLPAEQEIPSLLESLSVLARRANVKISSITPGAADQGTIASTSVIYQEIPILITAKSGYHELGAFVSSLENADRFMRVADIDIKADRSDTRKHDVNLVVLTYILLKE